MNPASCGREQELGKISMHGKGRAQTCRTKIENAEGICHLHRPRPAVTLFLESMTSALAVPENASQEVVGSYKKKQTGSESTGQQCE